MPADALTASLQAKVDDLTTKLTNARATEATRAANLEDSRQRVRRLDAKLTSVQAALDALLNLDE